MNQNLLLILSIVMVIFLLRNGLKTNNILLSLIVASMSLMCMKSRDPKNKANEICLLVSIYFGSVLLAKVMALNEQFEDTKVIVDQETANEASNNLEVATNTNTPAETTSAPAETTSAPAETTQASETKGQSVPAEVYRGMMRANNMTCDFRVANAINETRNLFK